MHYGNPSVLVYDTVIRTTREFHYIDVMSLISSSRKHGFGAYNELSAAFAGNNEEIFMVIQSLNGLVDQGKTIVVIDHEENSFKYFSKHIVLANDNGVLKQGE